MKGAVLWAAIVLLLAACQALPGAAPNPLAGTRWQLETIQAIAPLPGPRLTLEFDAEGNVGGYTGCNDFGGSYVVQGNALRFGEDGLMMSAVGCEAAISDQERRYSAALRQSVRFQLAPERLLLLDQAGNELLRFVAQPRFDTDPEALRDSFWTLRALDGAALLPGSEITLGIEADNQLRGWSGCRRYEASYRAEGDRISVPSMQMLDLVCIAPERYLLQEGAFTTLLGQARQVQLVEGELLLFNAAGQTLRFAPRAADVPEPLGPRWELEAFERGGVAVPVLAGSRPTLELGATQVAGSGGCNRFFGSAYQEGERLIVEGVASTEMACMEPPGVLEQEGRYLSALTGPLRPLVQGDQLRLERDDGTALRFRAAPAD